MRSNKKDLRGELDAYRFEFDVLQKVMCDARESEDYATLLKEGKPLPDGVYSEEGVGGATVFYTVYDPELSDEEKNEYLTYRRLAYLRTIKNCAIFFTVLTIIGLIAALILPSLY